MTLISEILGGYLKDYEISLDSEMLQKFDIYTDLLLEWNKKINLTAITEMREIAVKHFLDSLLLLKAIELPQDPELIDIGTGAGFPAIPLKIARPDMRVTLLDSLNKRINFLSELSRMLNQDNIIIHGRAEQLGHEERFREQFNFVTARGVASLPALCEYCLPFIRIGGMFAALKGPGMKEELQKSKSAMQILGSELVAIKNYDLPFDSKRTIILIRKVSQIPQKYPRIQSKITKDPL